MKLLAGNSNAPLARAISEYLEIPLTKASVRRFADEFGPIARQRGDHRFDRFLSQLARNHGQAARVKLRDVTGTRIARAEALGDSAFEAGQGIHPPCMAGGGRSGQAVSRAAGARRGDRRSPRAPLTRTGPSPKVRAPPFPPPWPATL